MGQGFRRTRRQFVQSALAVAAGSALPGAREATAQAAGAARLKVGLTPPANQVTMGYLGQSADTGPQQPMYEYLIRSDRFTGALGSDLATEWERSPDGKTWRFKLRPNISFHDGSRLTAADVPFSWQLLTGQDSRATSAALWRELIKSINDIKVINDLEVVFNLARPEPELLYYLCQAQGFMIYSKAYWDKVGAAGYRQKPVGTGPFKFREFKAGEYILYDRVESHWRQTPEFRELQMFFMPEDITRLAALLSGEIHIAEIPRAVQNQAVARGMKILASTRPAVQTFGAFGGNYLADRGKPNNGPLTNKLVREAMNIAINRQEINEQIYGGRGVIEIVQPYQPDDPITNPAWKPYPYDPARARQLLAQAGYASGFDFEMSVVTPPGFPEFPSVVEAMAMYFKAIGIRPKLVQMEVATLVTKQRTMDFRNVLSSNRQSLQPLFYYVPANYWSKLTIHFFEDPYIEERMERLANSVDDKERFQMLREVGDFLYNEYATLPLLFLNAEVAADPKVVAEYKADIGAFGASVGHEYTKATR